MPHDELLLHAATRVIALPILARLLRRVMQRPDADSSTTGPRSIRVYVPAEKYRSRRFACLNTFDPHKGHATLLRAAALLKAEKRGFRAGLYGDGPVHGVKRKRRAAAGLAGHVRFHAGRPGPTKCTIVRWPSSIRPTSNPSV